jgi:hypothetical protein
MGSAGSGCGLTIIWSSLKGGMAGQYQSATGLHRPWDAFPRVKLYGALSCSARLCKPSPTSHLELPGQTSTTLAGRFPGNSTMPAPSHPYLSLEHTATFRTMGPP